MSDTTSSKTAQGYGATGQHIVNLQVGGKPIPIFIKSGVHLLEVQNVNSVLPALQLSILDVFGLYADSTTAINDGTKFTLSFSDGNTGLPNSSNWVAYGTPTRKRHAAGNDELLVTARLDNVKYARETVNRGIAGPSTQVISKIANILNMKYQTNDSSNDSMTWLPGRATWSKFVSNISKHAYTDESSVFSHAVTTSNTLMYMNLQKLFAAKKYKSVFYRGAAPQDTSEPSFEIYDYHAENNSGFLNHFYGYGMRQGQTSGTGVANINTNVNASYLTGSNLDVNKSVSKSLSNRTRIQLSPIDCGNSHNNFIKAKHQNSRLKSTYAQTLYGMFTQDTQSNL